MRVMASSSANHNSLTAQTKSARPSLAARRLQRNIVGSVKAIGEAADELSHSLVGKIFAKDMIEVEEVHDEINLLWGRYKIKEIKVMGHNLYVFKLETENDQKMILRKSPWAIKGYLLSLQKYNIEVPLENLRFTHQEFCVKFSKLQPEHLNVKVIDKCLASLGKKISTNPKNCNPKSGNTVQAQIKMDLTKPLRRGGWWRTAAGGVVWVKYHWQMQPHNLCDKCFVIDHLEENCAHIAYQLQVSGVFDIEDETVDCNINGSLKSVSEEKHPMPKKRKILDAESMFDRSSSGGHKSSRMSNGCCKNSNEEKRAGEASVQPLHKSKETSVSVYEKIPAAHAEEMSPDGVNTIPGCSDEKIPSPPSSLKTFEMPETEFNNFDEERSCEKFKAGQIWALYTKLDKLPKNYAQIVSYESLPVFKLAVKWLKSCAPPRGVIPWVDNEMPVSCGTFKVTSSEVVVFNNSSSFSHQLNEVPAVNNVYTIYPRAGEVWALYSKFRLDLVCSDLRKCEYSIVEILEVVDVRWIIVSVLQRVAGFKTLFKAKEREGLDSIVAIPWIELYRFSHRVPTFILSGARYGKLRGCWEIDPRSSNHIVDI